MSTSISYLDVAARAACAAVKNRKKFEKTQVNMLLEVLEDANEEEAIQVLIAYIARQMGRNSIDKNAGKILINYLLTFIKKALFKNKK